MKSPIVPKPIPIVFHTTAQQQQPVYPPRAFTDHAIPFDIDHLREWE